MLPTQTYFRFIGLSSSTKPTTADDGRTLPDGSTFDEQDTGNRWVWSQASLTWSSQGYQQSPNDLASAVKDNMILARRQLAAIGRELRAIRILIATVNGISVPGCEEDEQAEFFAR
jgi:hypothetical protein